MTLPHPDMQCRVFIIRWMTIFCRSHRSHAAALASAGMTWLLRYWIRIFYCSGTLLVDVWCDGDCGLNQHLFKVTSSNYPKWYYSYWTKYHLANFIRIEKDKAVTMGHIKRSHLESLNIHLNKEKQNYLIIFLLY